MVSSVSGRWKPSLNLRFLLQSKRNPKEEKLCSSAALLVLPNPKMTRLLEMETSPVAGSMWTWPRYRMWIRFDLRWLMFKKEFDSSYVGFMKDGAKWLVKNTEILLCMHLSQIAGGMKPMNAGTSRAKKELKHLKVLGLAVIYIMMFVLNLYEYTKKNLGPLRSIVWTVEVAMINIVALMYWRFEVSMINIVAPIYRRFEGVPDDFLGLLNTKVPIHGYIRQQEKIHAPT